MDQKTAFIETDGDRNYLLDDFEVGDRLRTGEILVPAAAIHSFAAEFDPQAIHLDETVARGSFFGELVGSGWHIAVLTMKLMVESRVLGATPIIGSEVDCIRFIQPLRAGDCLHTDAIVIGKRRSRIGGKGYLTLALTTLRADGAVVLTQQWTLIVPAAT